MQRNFKNTLAATTALMGIALAQPALAVDFVVSAVTTFPVALGNGDTLTTTPVGLVSVGSGSAVTISGTNAALVTNQGAILAPAGVGIHNMDGDITGGIINSGTINALFGIAVTGSDGMLSGLINNSGTITASQNGIFLNAGASADGGLLNSGTISGDGALFVNSGSSMGNIVNNGSLLSSGRGVMVIESSIGSFTNAGTLSSAAGEGLFLNTDSILNGDVVNSGDILATSGAGIGVYMNSAITGAVRNSGTISGTNGIDISDGEITGGIINESGGVIQATLGNAIVLNSLSSAVIPLRINGGRIIGAVRDESPGRNLLPVTVGGNFTSEGDFVVPSLNILAGNTFTVGNGYTLDTKAMAFGVDSAANVGRLVVDNGALNLTGVTVSADVSLVPTLNDGDEFMVADGDLAIIGGPGGVRTAITDNSALWDFEMADGTAASTPTDDTDLFFFATRVGGAGGNPNQDVIDAILALGGSPDFGVQNAIDNVNNAPSQTVLQDVLASLQSRVNGGTQHGAKAFAEAAFGVTGDHLNKKSDETGISTGDPWKALRAWGQVFGQTADQGVRGGVGGFDADTAGVALGLESETLFDSCVAGVSLGYGRTNVDNKSATNASNGSADIDSYQLGLYGQAALGNRVYLRGMASYSFNSNETARYNVGGAGGPTAVADFDASQYALRLETGRSYAAGSAMLTPSLMANVLHYSPDSYTETGAGGLNLNVRGKDVTIAELGAGVKAQWEYKQADGSKFLPELHGGYRYDLVGDAVESTSAFTGGGGSFATTGSSPARSRFNFGAGLTYQTSSSWELHTGYDLDVKEGYHAHSGTLRASIRF